MAYISRQRSHDSANLPVPGLPLKVSKHGCVQAIRRFPSEFGRKSLEPG